MKIAVIGTGGVGGYFGGRLAQAGYDVTLVARGEHLQMIRKQGLTVKSILGDFIIHTARVVEKIEEISSPDLILLGVKAWQVKDICTQLKQVIHPATTVLTLQNGVMAHEEVAAILGSSVALPGLCRIFSKIESPGVIVHYGIEPEIVLGEINHLQTSRVKNIHDLLLNSGINARIAEDIQTELWKKLIIIGSGGLLALTRSNYGPVREIKESRTLMIALLEEIRNVAVKSGASIHSDFIEKTIRYIDAYPPDSNTSLARDIWNEKPSELEYQNGSVVKIGESLQVPTPVNRFIYHCLLPLERRARENAER